MFDEKDWKCLDPERFNIIIVDEYDVTVMSQNTGHYRYVYCTDVPGDMACIFSYA